MTTTPRRYRGPSQPRLERLDDFDMVLRTRTKPNGDPISIAEAAKAVGVSHRTGWRYLRDLRQQKRTTR